MSREFLDEAERGYLNGLAKDAGTTRADLTRDDLSISFNAQSITVSAVINGYREKTQYIFVSEDEAVADFLATYGEDA
jgi:hypothetical protein